MNYEPVIDDTRDALSAGPLSCSLVVRSPASEELPKYWNRVRIPTHHTYSYADLKHAQAKAEIIAILSSEQLIDLSLSLQESVQISNESRDSAIKLVQGIGDDRCLPQAVPDGEGDLMLIWGNPAVLMITVEKDLLHAVVRPGTSVAKYIPAVSFNGRSLPREISRLIPLR